MMNKLVISFVLGCTISTMAMAEDDCPLPPNAIGCLSEGLAPAYKEQGKNTLWGFVDAKGKTVIPLKYQNVGAFKEGIAFASLNNKTGMIDKTGKVVIPFKYDAIGSPYEGLISVASKGKQGFIDKQGNIVIPLKYSVDEVGAEGGEGGWASVDANYFSEGLSAVKKGNKWGFIDKQGNQIIPFKYNEVGPFSEGLAEVSMGDNEKIGFIDKTGKLVIPVMYNSYIEEATFYKPATFKNGKAKLKGETDENGNSICINKQNKQVSCN